MFISNLQIKVDEYVIALDSTAAMKEFQNYVVIALQFFLRSLNENTSFQVCVVDT